jgi:hypothetical protein
MATHTVNINRAPVLTLWAAVVAERLGYDHEAALTLGKAVAGLNAQSKGRRLGMFEEPKGSHEARERQHGNRASHCWSAFCIGGCRSSGRTKRHCPWFWPTLWGSARGDEPPMLQVTAAARLAAL